MNKKVYSTILIVFVFTFAIIVFSLMNYKHYSMAAGFGELEPNFTDEIILDLSNARVEVVGTDYDEVLLEHNGISIIGNEFKALEKFDVKQIKWGQKIVYRDKDKKFLSYKIQSWLSFPQIENKYNQGSLDVSIGKSKITISVPKYAKVDIKAKSVTAYKCILEKVTADEVNIKKCSIIDGFVGVVKKVLVKDSKISDKSEFKTDDVKEINNTHVKELKYYECY